MHDNPLQDKEKKDKKEKDNGIAPGWEELVDETTGNLYYYELSTFVTVWLKENTWKDVYVKHFTNENKEIANLLGNNPFEKEELEDEEKEKEKETIKYKKEI